MKPKALFFVFILVLLFSASACDSILPTEDEGALETQQEATLQKKLEEAKTSTAAFETSVAKALTEEAPPPTATFTSTPVPTDTPSATDTPMPTDTPEPTETPLYTATATTDPHPWVMQEWCLDHDGCERLEVKNKQPNWINITLTYLETGEVKFFAIQPKGHAWITLRPGRYRYKFKHCGGTEVDEGIHPLTSNWYIQFLTSFCK